MSINTLTSAALYSATPLTDIGYKTTADIHATEYEVIGQSRAMQAIEFAIGMQRDNYNLYLAGSMGLGKYSAINKVLVQHAKSANTPDDWCYVDNFEEFYKPLALRLPAGMGSKLKADMVKLVDELIIAIPSAFESGEYRSRAQEIEEFDTERREKAFEELSDQALKQQISLLETQAGYTLVPLSGDKPMEKEALDKLPEDKQQEIETKIDALKTELKLLILKLPEWQKETREHFKELNTQFAKATVEQFFKTLLDDYSRLPQVASYLENVRQDIVQNIHYFLPGNAEQTVIEGQRSMPPPELARYEVNVLVNNSALQGAPVIFENNPTYNNLLGRIEHIAQEGALITDFTLIKPGALQRANGGYLILDIEKLLLDSFAWEGLKRVLYAREIRMESLERLLSLVSTVTLEPEPIPLDIKVILLGDRTLYYLLKTYDPEFNELFKVTADFSESFDRDAGSVRQLAKIISAVANKENVRPIVQDGVARIIEHCSREMEDAEKLSLHMGQLKDLILESDYWAGISHQKVVASEQVQSAIDARLQRANQIYELEREQILRGIVLIDTQGVCSGQVNGLSVYQMGEFSFGQPSRITATARLGHGNVMDIEREIKMGGPIHSKGVMILSSCLANRYARDRPLSLSATLVFEQNYGGVDGDSASIAEYCALISALSDIPICQCYAVTGSINQHGEAQAIGGVNQKIEGFFDICKQRGLTGKQGVIIPAANAKHLMLNKDVVEAVASKQFKILTVDSVDDALQILMKMPIGEVALDGSYAEGTINYRVMQRLQELQQLHQHFSRSEKDMLPETDKNDDD